MQLRLVRVAENNGATKGALCFDNEPELLTLELPWLDNETKLSCIPEGKYRVSLQFSQRFQRPLFKIMDVPGRSGILFHSGNTVRDIEGCILIGQRFGHLDGFPAVLNSQKALDRFFTLMDGATEANLIIVSAYGGGRAH